MTRIAMIAVLAAALTGLAATLASAGSTDKHDDRLAYRGVTAVVLQNTQGHVHITAGDSTGVTVTRTTQTLLTDVTTRAYVAGHVLHLTSRCHGALCQVDYRIHTPEGVGLRLHEQNATVSIDGAPGDLAVTTTQEGNLGLTLDKAPQHIRASTGKGDIDVTVPRGAYAVTARAHGGDRTITGITVNRKARHTVHASSDSGDIEIAGR